MNVTLSRYMMDFNPFRYFCRNDPRGVYIARRIEEMVGEDSTTGVVPVVQYLITQHPTAFCESFHRLMKDGSIAAIGTMDDLLHKAAEDIAHAEWMDRS